ncbi:MAG: lysophospholipid acyltransferase family protein [Moraxellaceae bacterium]
MTAIQDPRVRSFPQQAKQKINVLGRGLGMLATIGHGFGMAISSGAIFKPNQPHHPALTQQFCKRMCKTLGVAVQVHGVMPREHALWVSNHVSWIDIPVIGSLTRVFFLSKAEVARWPLMGRLARAGGTLFIQRGSGDSDKVRQQITSFLKQKLPILFFPEATTTDGKQVRRLHGRLLQSAIDTQTHVQPVVLCYVNAQQQLDLVLPFIGEISFAEHLQQVLAHPAVTVHVMVLPAISSVGHDVHSLTNLLQQQMREGLATLHAKVLLD